MNKSKNKYERTKMNYGLFRRNACTLTYWLNAKRVINIEETLYRNLHLRYHNIMMI